MNRGSGSPKKSIFAVFHSGCCVADGHLLHESAQETAQLLLVFTSLYPLAHHLGRHIGVDLHCGVVRRGRELQPGQFLLDALDLLGQLPQAAGHVDQVRRVAAQVLQQLVQVVTSALRFAQSGHQRLALRCALGCP
ncbi:MAG: hypothetical protein ACK4F4_07130 [Hylemonella sp.]|uniref:hypothetical protein n=1 Tax=Hylemonella sp. TaxID=2066020 RepID=UPI00391B66EC